MTRKTLHLITFQHEPKRALLDLVGTLRPLPRAMHRNSAVRTENVELVIPDASREEVMRIASGLSALHPQGHVDVHFRVNAVWSPFRPYEDEESASGAEQFVTAHVIHVREPVRAVLRAVRSSPAWWSGLDLHVQATGESTQIVVHGHPPIARVVRLLACLNEHGASSTVVLNVTGQWTPTGSRHHEFVRYRNGTLVPFEADLVWTD